MVHETMDGSTEAGNLCLEIYRRVLNRADLQPDEDFSQSGGDSVKAVLITTELEGVFGIDVPLTTFFEKGTVSAMATWINEVKS